MASNFPVANVVVDGNGCLCLSGAIIDLTNPAKTKSSPSQVDQPSWRERQYRMDGAAILAASVKLGRNGEKEYICTPPICRKFPGRQLLSGRCHPHTSWLKNTTGHEDPADYDGMKFRCPGWCELVASLGSALECRIRGTPFE